MYLGISEDVSRAKTHNSLKFAQALPRLSAQRYLVLSKSGATAAVCTRWGAYEARSETWTAPLIDEAGGRVAGKPAAKVRERHGHGVGNDRLPSGPVRPAAHRPP